MNTQQQSKRRTYNCMKQQDSNNKKTISDIDHLALLNNYLQHSDEDEQIKYIPTQESLAKKRKLTNNRLIIEEEKENNTESNVSNLPSIQIDFYEEMEQRMKVMCSRMNETLKKQDEYFEKYQVKKVKETNVETNKDEMIWSTLCGMYSIHSILHKRSGQ